MKIFRIVFTCFIVLWLAIYLYVDTKFAPHNLYWLYFKLVYYFLLVVFIVINQALKKESNKWSVIGLACIWTLLMSYWGYRDINKYKNNVCLDKFGLEFNSIRRSRGVPVIPVGWYEHYRSDHSTTWERKDSVAGTITKTLGLIPLVR